MKKLLTLVLVLAVATMASASATFIVTDNMDGTVDIDYTGEIVGMALNIDSDVAISAVSLPAFFDVYMDYASEQAEGTYVVGQGTPIANIAAAGEMALPATDFCISAGGLEDDIPGDTAPLSGTITLTIQDYASLAEGTYTIAVSENSLRGGVVGFAGAMTTDLTTNGSVDVVIEGGDTPEQIAWDAMNANGDGFVNTQDAVALIGFINANGAAPFYSIPSSAPAYDASYDVNGDGFINTQDAVALIGYINSNGMPPFYSIVRP